MNTDQTLRDIRQAIGALEWVYKTYDPEKTSVEELSEKLEYAIKRLRQIEKALSPS
jgi:hypothetical protein